MRQFALGGFQPVHVSVGTPASSRLTCEPVARWIRALALSGGLLLVVEDMVQTVWGKANLSLSTPEAGSDDTLSMSDNR